MRFWTSDLIDNFPFLKFITQAGTFIKITCKEFLALNYIFLIFTIGKAHRYGSTVIMNLVKPKTMRPITLGHRKLKFDDKFFNILKGIVNTIDGGKLGDLLNEDTMTQGNINLLCWSHESYNLVWGWTTYIFTISFHLCKIRKCNCIVGIVLVHT